MVTHNTYNLQHYFLNHLLILLKQQTAKLDWIEEWLKRGMCESAGTMTSLLNMNVML